MAGNPRLVEAGTAAPERVAAAAPPGVESDGARERVDLARLRPICEVAALLGWSKHDAGRLRRAGCLKVWGRMTRLDWAIEAMDKAAEAGAERGQTT